jgi:cytochrome c oxidase subunit 4
MEFQDGFPNYETLAQHDNEAGKGVRKRLMNVFYLLLVVTLIEVVIGWFWSETIQPATGLTKTWLIIGFIMFTLLKAGYIVMTFMHLGDETKWMRWMILGPYFIFAVYLIYMVNVTEGHYSANREHRSLLDTLPQSAMPAPAAHHE